MTRVEEKRDTTRVQIEMPKRSMQRLQSLKEQTEATSYAEVVKNALRLYEALIAEIEAGRELHIKDSDGRIAPIKLFL